MSKRFTRSDLLSPKLPQHKVLVPELGEGVVLLIREMSISTRVKFLERIRQQVVAFNEWKADQELPAAERKNITEPERFDDGLWAIILSVVDEEGAFEFTEADMPLFDDFPYNAAVRLVEAINVFNGFTQTANEEVEAEKKD